MASAQSAQLANALVSTSTNIQSATSDTTVVQQSNQLNITGGQLSNGPEPNVVHQFSQFNVGPGDSANFIVNPNVANVISLIDSLQPSTIDGLLQLTSSDSSVASRANLILINPVGIVFGEHASLSLPANLTATTASSVLFDDTFRLSIDGSVSDIALSPSNSVPSVDDLTGHPMGYFFTDASTNLSVNLRASALPAGSISNQGSLRVSPQSTITLMGQYVQNDGALVAPGGRVNLIAIAGTRLLRLQQPGDILSLDLDSAESLAASSTTQFPELLTGGNSSEATQIDISFDGSQVLTSSQTSSLTPAPGNVLVRGRVDVSDDSIQGTVKILGENINLIGGDIHADGGNQAGTLSIGDSANTDTVFVDRNSVLSANAVSGTGGIIRVRAAETVRFYGNATTTGSIPSRNGQVMIDAGENLDIRRPVSQ